MNTTEGKLYFTALRSLEKLEIQFVPKELAINRGINVAAIAVVGRNNPFYHYTGGTTGLVFDLDFHAEEENLNDVIRKCKWLESLCYSNSMSEPPEQVKLTWGDLFKKGEVWMVKGFSYKLSMFDPSKGMLPRQAYANIALELDVKNNIRTRDVRWT